MYPQLALVVEDQPQVRQIMSMVLAKNGIRVLEAADGQEARDVIEHDDPIDLLVADVGLPGAIDGWCVVESAVDAHPHLKVLVISGEGGQIPSRFGGSACTLAVLQKPFTPSTLMASISDLCGRSA